MTKNNETVSKCSAIVFKNDAVTSKISTTIKQLRKTDCISFDIALR